MIANFLDFFKTVWIFQMTANFQNCPDFSSLLPIFLNLSKLSGFFQMTANFPDYFKTVRTFPDDCQVSELFKNCLDFPDDCQFSVKGGGDKDIHCAFFGNVVRGKSVLFSFVVRNGFVHFVRKVFARRKLLSGKLWVFAH